MKSLRLRLSGRWRLSGRLVAALIFVALPATAGKAGPLEDCAPMLPWGVPVMANDGAPHTYLCRLAYVVRHNDVRHLPDWVAWPTSQANAPGCLPRSDSFRTDPDLPPGAGATPKDYKEPKFDQGHVAGDAYFNYAAEPERESFLMSNMTPQTVASNRGPYSALEIASREWAAATAGGVWSIAGPIFAPRPKTIGKTRVAVPAANWKIVVRGDGAVAVIIPNRMSFAGQHRWQDFIVPIAEVERQARIRVNLPPGIPRDTAAPPWPIDRGPWTVAHQAVCAAGG
jgi:DNA/RNA endonuclease G (NUC1)